MIQTLKEAQLPEGILLELIQQSYLLETPNALKRNALESLLQRPYEKATLAVFKSWREMDQGGDREKAGNYLKRGMEEYRKAQSGILQHAKFLSHVALAQSRLKPKESFETFQEIEDLYAANLENPQLRGRWLDFQAEYFHRMDDHAALKELLTEVLQFEAESANFNLSGKEQAVQKLNVLDLLLDEMPFSEFLKMLPPDIPLRQLQIIFVHAIQKYSREDQFEKALATYQIAQENKEMFDQLLFWILVDSFMNSGNPADPRLHSTWIPILEKETHRRLLESSKNYERLTLGLPKTAEEMQHHYLQKEYNEQLFPLAFGIWGALLTQLARGDPLELAQAFGNYKKAILFYRKNWSPQSEPDPLASILYRQLLHSPFWENVRLEELKDLFEALTGPETNISMVTINLSPFPSPKSPEGKGDPEVEQSA